MQHKTDDDDGNSAILACYKTYGNNLLTELVLYFIKNGDCTEVSIQELDKFIDIANIKENKGWICSYHKLFLV